MPWLACRRVTYAAYRNTRGQRNAEPAIDPLLVGLVCFCGVTTPNFAADETAQPQVPVFSHADFSWFPVRGEFLPPPSGPGPISYDKAHPRTVRTVNNIGDVQETTMHLADLSNPNLKRWVIDALKKANEERLAGVYMYASRASCRPPGVPMFLIYVQPLQGMLPADASLVMIRSAVVNGTCTWMALHVSPPMLWRIR